MKYSHKCSRGHASTGIAGSLRFHMWFFCAKVSKCLVLRLLPNL